MFVQGFEKTSGIFQRLKDKLIGHVTGNEYLYHGTSNKNSKKIVDGGLSPDKRGISEFVAAAGSGNKTLRDQNAGLVFTTKDKHIAKAYAHQAESLEKVKKLNAYVKLLSKKLPKGDVRDILNVATSRGIRRMTTMPLSRQYMATPFLPKGTVLKAAIPKSELAAREIVKNPEIKGLFRKLTAGKKFVREELPGAKKYIDSPIGKFVSKKIIKFISTFPYKHDVVIRGALKKGLLKK